MNRFFRLMLGLSCLVLAVTLLFGQVAFGAPQLQVKVDGVRVDDGDIRLVNSKTITISVYDDNGQTTGVLINNKAAKSVKEEVYTWETSCSLKIGKNDMVLKAKWAQGSQLFNFSVVYVTSPVPGLSYAVSTLPASGKIEAFNKALVLTYPKDNILVNSEGDVWGTERGEDQSLTFEIVKPPSDLDDRRPDNYHYLASPNVPYVIKITSDAGAQLLYPGQLTLTYDQNISSSVANQLAIWFSPDQDWSDADNYILGGYADTGKRTVTAPFQLSQSGVGYYAVFLSQREFREFQGTDGTAVSWSYSCVLPLWAKGVAETNDQGPTSETRNKVKTTDDNWFGLLNDDGSKKNITRLEFAAMMVKGLALSLVKKPSDSREQIFSDVDYNDAPDQSAYFGSSYSSEVNYYEPSLIQYVETCCRNGIFVGYPDGKFKPMNELTRQEAAVVLSRVANLKLSDDDEKVRSELEKIYEDAGSIPLWAASSVLAAQKAKLIAGEPGSDSKSKLLKFNPGGKLSRAEAITFTYRLMKKLKKI